MSEISNLPRFPVPKRVAFTNPERELLATLISEQPIIDNKVFNAKSKLLKKKAWETLTSIYNACPNVTPRTSHQLKRAWENLKTMRNRELGLTYARTKQYLCDQTNEIHSPPTVEIEVPSAVDSNATDSNIDGSIEEQEYSFNGSEEYQEMYQDQIDDTILHRNIVQQLRVEREKIALQRERNLMEFERQSQELQLEKLKLQIELLKKNISEG